jgi:acetoin utilization deacetylase AcuC-like enzyme
LRLPTCRQVSDEIWRAKLGLFVYSKGYYVDIGEHVFPMEKYRLVHQDLLKEGFREADFVEPEPAKDEDVLLAHTEDYVRKLKTGTLSPSEILILELPYSPDLWLSLSEVCRRIKRLRGLLWLTATSIRVTGQP